MYITIYKIDDQCKLSAWSRALKACALGQPRGMRWGGRCEEILGGGHICTYGWFMSTYGKNHHNIVIILQLQKNFLKALSEQCKEIEENNRMGKSRYLFKKIINAKGTFHAKMGTITVRNGTDLTETDIKQRWQELHRKTVQTSLTDPNNHDGVIAHLEPNILELYKYQHYN